jgi:hypothetical protein
MMDSQYIEQDGHVTGLLAEHVNGALSAEARQTVDDHLAGCAECRAERLEWLAIATASARFVENAERLVEHRAKPASIFGATFDGVLTNAETKEQAMHAQSVMIPSGNRRARIRPGELGAAARDWVRPALEVAVAAVLVFAMVGGFLVYRANEPGSTGNFAAVNSPAATKTCAATPRSADALVQALQIGAVLSSNSADLAPALDEGLNYSAGMLPQGSTPDQGTLDAVTTLWNQFVACAALDPMQSSALLTDAALRRLFYANVWTSLNGVIGAMDTKSAGTLPTVVPTAEQDQSSGSEQSAATQPAVTQSSLIAQPSKYTLGQMIQMNDGRVFVLLTGGSDSGAAAPVGYIVVTQSNGVWLIDETRIYMG